METQSQHVPRAPSAGPQRLASYRLLGVAAVLAVAAGAACGGTTASADEAAGGGGSGAVGAVGAVGGAGTAGASTGGTGGVNTGGAAGAAAGSAGAAVESLVIDDFEDGDLTSALGTQWGTFTDAGNQGKSTAKLAVAAGDGSSKALSAEYVLSKGDYPYDPFIGVTLALRPDGSALDLSRFAAVRVRYRGPARTLRLETSDVADYDFHGFLLPATADWQTLEIKLTEFQQQGWGKTVPFDASHVSRVSFHLTAPSGSTGALEVEELTLLTVAAAPSGPPDLELLPAAPPTLTPIGPITITNPLHALALKSLDKGYNLASWLEAGRFSGFTYGEDYVKKLAAAGFKSLRLPIDLDLYVVASEPNLVLHDDLWTVLDSFNGWTKASGLSFTIDYHQYDGDFKATDAKNNALMAALWGAVAAHFATETREDLFYELQNEPELAAGNSGGPTAEEWTTIAQSFIDAIRVEDGNHPIIFGDTKWYDLDQLVKRKPFSDPKVVYAFHFYEPFMFTHQKASWAGLGGLHGVPYPYTPARWATHFRDLGLTGLEPQWQLDLLRNYYRDGTRNQLENRIGKVKQWAVANNVPLICNEFGAYKPPTDGDRDAYLADLTAIFRKLAIPWQHWFTIMDEKTGAVDPSLAKALGL